MSDPMFEEEFQESADIEIRRGKVVRGRVIFIMDDSVVVNIGYKYDGLVPISEFSGNLPKEGEEIPVIIRRIDDRAGVVWLSYRSAEKKEASQKLFEHKEKGEPIKGKVVKRIKGGYLIDLGFRAFKGILLDELSGETKGERLEAGSEIDAYIDAIDLRRRRAILDRERLLSERKDREIQELMASLKVGQKIKGKIKNITDFGIFVNVGPIDVLVRNRELSWRKLENPKEVFREGQEVELVLTQIDFENKKLQGSIRLATKTRWHIMAEKVKVGDIFEGKVKKKTKSGIYVWLSPGLDGLLPLEEFEKYIRDISTLAEGESIRVRVKSVDIPAKRIILTHPTR
ncbi:MAG: S1 RNA-binding domain-containing protein [Actinobacteria bacterium]|nr:S1 RNA-binding domain-containing protein [Actinomycetota bacterium]